MKYDSSFEASRARRDDIRLLGFDPDHLTPEEQRELLELESRLRSTADRHRDLAAR